MIETGYTTPLQAEKDAAALEFLWQQFTGFAREGWDFYENFQSGPRVPEAVSIDATTFGPVAAPEEIDVEHTLRKLRSDNPHHQFDAIPGAHFQLIDRSTGEHRLMVNYTPGAAMILRRPKPEPTTDV